MTEQYSLLLRQIFRLINSTTTLIVSPSSLHLLCHCPPSYPTLHSALDCFSFLPHFTPGNSATPTMTSPNLIFGAGGIGHTENSFTFTWETPEAVSELLDKLKALDILELDSSASYPPGNPWHTETLIGKANAVEKGFIVDTKVLIQNGGLNDKNITSSVDKSLSLLGRGKIRVFYAHLPDPETPLEETAKAMHKQFLAGKFEKVGFHS